jgi:hypothetical protein
MTAEDKIEIKDFIHTAMIGYVARVEAQNEITNNRLGAIDAHLTKQNGRIGKAEEAIALALQERAANRQKQEDYFSEIDDLDDRLTIVEGKEAGHVQNCPNVDKIRKLEDESLSNASVKKFMGVMFTGGVALGALIVGILKLILG